MNRKFKGLFFVVLIILAFSLTACEKEGTAEKADKTLDKAFNTAKDKINDATK